MRVLYHLPILPPQMPAGEALSQEIQMLRDAIGGDLIYVNPNGQSPVYIPRLLFGLAMLKRIRAAERETDLHHFYNPDPFPFPYLLRLERPVIYTLSSGLGDARIAARYFNRLGAVTVYDERSLERLRKAGVKNAQLIPPGIDTTRFSCMPLPLAQDLRLLVASAPWTQAQFRTKGIDALLGAAQRDAQLHLTFLWRGVLLEEMQERIRRHGLGAQVTVINAFVDVNQILATVHATVVLASDGRVIKAYPHSLMESLAAGKPVLVSRAIPMAESVSKMGCGIVVDTLAPGTVSRAIAALRADYGRLAAQAAGVGQHDFSSQRSLAAYSQLYRAMVNAGKGHLP